MPTKTELALKTKEELIEDLLGLTNEKEKLKLKIASAGGDVTNEIVKALQSLAARGNATPDQPIDTTPQGYAVLPPIPINSMLPIQKVKWRIDNVTAILAKGGLKPEIAQELRRKIFVWQKKLSELYELMVKNSPDLLKTIGFGIKEYYDANIEEINKRIAARQRDNAKYNMPVKHHVYK